MASSKQEDLMLKHFLGALLITGLSASGASAQLAAKKSLTLAAAKQMA